MIKRLNFILSLFVVALGQPARVGWLGAVAAVAGFALFFLSLSSSLSRMQKFSAGTAWFFGVQLIQLSWMTSIEFQGYYILVVYVLISLWLGAQFGLLTLFVPVGEERLSMREILFCASLWTLMEWGRLLILCGFSWNPIGLALTYFIPSLQFASVFGVLGLSFWVMMTNLMGLNVLRSSIKQAPYWLFLTFIPYLYGLAQLHYFPTRQQQTLDLALIQTDLLPSEKSPYDGRAEDFISPFEQWERILSFFKEKQIKRSDLILLPEAAVAMPSDLCNYPYSRAREIWVKAFGAESENKLPPLRAPFAHQRDFFGEKIWCVSNLFWCQALANLFDSEVVAGLDHCDRGVKKNFNSAFYFKPNSLSFHRYDKQILLPLAEYIPFNFLKPLTKSYGINDFFAHGEVTKIFGEKVPFSPSICYEETFSEMMREGRSFGAELFVNMTNDNYFPASSLHGQHLYHARLRAVENGIPLARACNSGGTAVIDSFGRLAAQFEGREGILNYHLTAAHFPTLFSFWGDAGIVSLCLIFFLYNLRFRLEVKP